jgi:transposase
MDKRIYPISRDFFDKSINPLIVSCYSAAGRPKKISNYQVFSAILYVLRTGIPWRDLPSNYGNWHSIYLRFKKGSDRGVWWNILLKLQQDNKLTMRVVMADSTTVKVHRHGGGQKGGTALEA